VFVGACVGAVVGSIVGGNAVLYAAVTSACVISPENILKVVISPEK
jgi:hypothetical protein